MTLSRRGWGVVWFAAWIVPFTLASAVPADAVQEPDDPPVTMDLGARLQVRFTGTDPDGGEDGTNTVRVRRARISLSGDAYERFSYGIQVDLAGSGNTLLDGYVRFAATESLTLWMGQGKALFGRELLTSSANLQFVDRTIVHSRFTPDRQQGVALVGRFAGNRVETNLAVYNGEGIESSVNSDNRVMTVGRVVFTPWGSYAPVQSAHDRPEDPRLAIGVAGFHNESGEGEEEVDITRLNLEAAFKLHGFSATGEVYHETADPVAAEEFSTTGWYAQGGYLFPGLRHELAGRVATISPEGGDADRTELGVAYSYYLSQHNAKIQADLRNVRDDATDSDHRELRVQLQLVL